MFVANTLTVWIQALQGVFNENYPTEGFREITVSPDYPVEQIQYPSLWVNFSMQGTARNVGVSHEEFVESDTGTTRVYRWQYGGVVEITISAMGNLERALMIDELVKVIAIGRKGENAEGNLRGHVESNELLAMNVVWESLNVGGFSESQGTPWGTDDVIYEATVSLDLEGECVVDPDSGDLVLLSEVKVIPYIPPEPAPAGTWV